MLFNDGPHLGVQRFTGGTIGGSLVGKWLSDRSVSCLERPDTAQQIHNQQAV